jgi:hypothetical protein
VDDKCINFLINVNYDVSNTIDTPFIPVLCKDFTSNILYFGIFFEATCTILYGFLQYIK